MLGKISLEDVREWLDYDPDRGVFYWKKSPANSVKAGDVAGCANRRKDGMERLFIMLRGNRIAASRAAFMIMTGESIPDGVLIDHINGDTSDDRWENLRIASEAQNTWNRIGHGARWKLGVSKDKHSRFKARIQMPDGRKFNLGSWDTEAEAHAAYMGAAAVLHGEFWIGNRDQEPVHLRALADSLNT